MAHTFLRSTGNALVVSMALAMGSPSVARAATPTCETLNAAAVAGILGVAKAKATPSNAKHGTLSPDNMDLLTCSYNEDSFDPLAKTFAYLVYTPIPKDLGSVFASVSTPNIQRNPQKFSPGIGTGSTGWVRLSGNEKTYDGSIVFHGATNIIEVKISGMPSADAAKAALLKAGNILAKS